MLLKEKKRMVIDGENTCIAGTFVLKRKVSIAGA